MQGRREEIRDRSKNYAGPPPISLIFFKIILEGIVLPRWCRLNFIQMAFGERSKL